MNKYLIAFLIGIIAIGTLHGQDIIYCENANPPFSYDRDNRACGIYPEIIREIYSQLHQDVTLIPVPWQRALSTVKNTQTGIGGLVKNSQREQYLDYTIPMYSEVFVIYYRMGKQKITSLDDLRGLTIGTIRGWSYGDVFDDAAKQNIFVIQDNISEKLNIEKLRYGRIDAVIAIEESSDLIIQELGLTDMIEKSEYSLNLDIYMAFNKKCNKQNDIQRINEIINKLQSDGLIMQIKKREIKAIQKT